MKYLQLVEEYPSRQDWKNMETPYVQLEEGKEPHYNYKPWNVIKYKTNGGTAKFGFNNLTTVNNSAFKDSAYETVHTSEGSEGTYEFMGDINSLREMCNTQTNLTELEFVNFDTSNLTSLARMFRGASPTAPIPLKKVSGWEHWDTSNVTEMDVMFQLCTQLTSLNLSHWDVSKCTTFINAFRNCEKLVSVGDLSNWDTSKVTDMSVMFNQCYALTSVGDLSNWDVSNVTTINSMFNKCYALTSVGDLSNWDTSNVTNMRSMFQECYELTSVGDLNKWDTSNVTDMGYMFNGYQTLMKLTSVGDLSNWDTSKVTNMLGMFSQCNALTSVGDLSNWDTSKVTNMSYMFSQCRSLSSLHNLNNWDISNVTSVICMFAECYSLTELDISGWDLSNVTDEGIINMFPNINGSQDRRDGDLTRLVLGKGYFNAPCEEYQLAHRTLTNWSHDSMIESLYTNQIGRDVTKVKTVYLDKAAYNRLSAEEIAMIGELGLNIMKL